MNNLTQDDWKAIMEAWSDRVGLNDQNLDEIDARYLMWEVETYVEKQNQKQETVDVYYIHNQNGPRRTITILNEENDND